MPNRKSVSGVIAFVMFFLMLGTVGGIENDTIPLLPGMIRPGTRSGPALHTARL